MISNNKLIIGNKEIHNLDKFNLILGNFQKEDLTFLENKALIKIFDNLDSIPMTLFIESLDNESDQFKNLNQINNVLILLNLQIKNIKQNSKILSNYNDFIYYLLNSFEFLLFNHKKNRAIKALKISNQYKISSEKLAIRDLIEKLRRSLKLNNNRLKYLEKDYLERKNQVEKIEKQIQIQNNRIKDQDDQKKQCFRYINYITQDIGGTLEEPGALGLEKIELSEELSNAEKIRALQIKARELQYDINKIKENINHDKQILETIRPQFELLENDYLKLKNQITQDQRKISDKQSELKQLVQTDELEDLGSQMIPLKSSEEIENEIRKLDSEIYEIADSDHLIDDFSPKRISLLLKKARNLLEAVQKLGSELNKEDSDNKSKIEIAFKAYHKIGDLLNEIELKLNLILERIDLNVSLKLSVSENYKEFLIEPKFQRIKEKNLQFNDLTTPEKIYVIMSFIIILQLIKGSKEIIFTNIFLPERFNKKGSIFRTIKKLIDLVQNNRSFNDVSMIFIIQGLEPKKIIPNLNVIRINETEK